MKKLLGGAIVLLCFCGLMVLGLWQVKRLSWKQDLLAQFSQGLNAPAQGWDGTAALPEFTHVKLGGGSLQPAPALYVYGRTYDGTAGLHVVALYRLDAGQSIVVDRGFLPVPLDPVKGEAPATGEIDGVIRIGNARNWMAPDNNVAKNQWFWMDLPAMTGALGGAPGGGALYVEALKPTAANGPVPTAEHLLENIPNNHLQYAITWFSLGTVLIVMYGFWLVRQAGRSRAE